MINYSSEKRDSMLDCTRKSMAVNLLILMVCPVVALVRSRQGYIQNTNDIALMSASEAAESPFVFSCTEFGILFGDRLRSG